MKLLIVDNHDSFTYNLVQIIKQAVRCSFEVIKNDKIDLSSVKHFDKILFTPGPGLPLEKPAMFEIVNIYSKSKSILGICLGHQAIAEAFGGMLFNMQNVYHGIAKKIRIIEKEDYLFKNIPEFFTGGLYHSWAVSSENFPESLNITAVASDETIMALSHKTYDVRGVQFHPESIMTACGKKIMENWLSY